jgi:hypothetical protein
VVVSIIIGDVNDNSTARKRFKFLPKYTPSPHHRVGRINQDLEGELHIGLRGTVRIERMDFPAEKENYPVASQLDGSFRQSPRKF